MAITTPENRQSPWRWLVVAVPYFWLLLFCGPLFHHLQNLAVGYGDLHAALYPCLRRLIEAR